MKFLFKERGVTECYGWTVSIEDSFENIQLNGDDFVLDAIGELEVPPTFPANVNPFLVCHDRSRGQIPLSGAKDGRQYRHSASPRGQKTTDYKNRLVIDFNFFLIQNIKIKIDSPVPKNKLFFNKKKYAFLKEPTTFIFFEMVYFYLIKEMLLT